MNKVFHKAPSVKLNEEEQYTALKNLAEYLTGAEAGIARKVLADGLGSLTEKQELVFNKYIAPQLVESCGFTGCPTLVISGQHYCSMHEIEYGS